MRFFEGDPVARPDVAAEDWIDPFGPSRGALVLAPGADRGWFGGLELLACSPRLLRIPAGTGARPYERTPALDAVGAALTRAMSAEEPRVAAALLRYDGSAVLGVFERGLARSSVGWHAWGRWGSPPIPAPPLRLADGAALIEAVRSSAERGAFCRAVSSAIGAMRSGDIYVLNVCRGYTGVPVADVARTASTLLSRTSASMGAVWDLPGGAVVSASPERFISLERGLLAVEPVKGTRPRSADPAADAAAAASLAACAKERAEHVMVVDLERNDLGRVCVPGSVVAAPLMRVETTPYCHQLVSRVGGLIAEGTRLADVLAATFPCGSVTGAPKRSAVAHIEAVEGFARREYTGALIVAVPGRLDSSVLIRTAVMTSDSLAYGVGCGITVDSDPEAEWEETLVKASPLLPGAPRD